MHHAHEAWKWFRLSMVFVDESDEVPREVRLHVKIFLESPRALMPCHLVDLRRTLQRGRTPRPSKALLQARCGTVLQ